MTGNTLGERRPPPGNDEELSVIDIYRQCLFVHNPAAAPSVASPPRQTAVTPAADASCCSYSATDFHHFPLFWGVLMLSHPSPQRQILKTHPDNIKCNICTAQLTCGMSSGDCKPWFMTDIKNEWQLNRTGVLILINNAECVNCRMQRASWGCEVVWSCPKSVIA